MKNTLEWNPVREETTKDIIDQRILSVSSTWPWRNTIRIIKKNGIPFNELKIIEIGCGTGTFSLTLRLMGASVTLLDINSEVLENTKRIYRFYDCEAEFLRADCLEDAPENLKSAFDFAVSGGLAEHFVSENRVKSIAYHKNLLKKGGFAFIGVPNRFSPFYWEVRLLRELTGTWNILDEDPFSYAELNRLAEKAGFNRSYVVGNAPLVKDFLVYSRGFLSAIGETLPGQVRKNLLAVKTKLSKDNRRPQKTLSREYMSEYLLNKAKDISVNTERRSLEFITDRFSSGLVLFGFV